MAVQIFSNPVVGFGASIILLLAAMNSIPVGLYEAAILDGASGWQKFRRITFPLLRPTIVFLLIIGTVETFREFTKQFYQQNGLVKGTIKIGDDTVDLQNITIPVMNIYARDDHLVPPDSSKALGGCVSSKDYTELEFPGGHIGIYVSRKAQSMIPPTVGKWLDERT